MRQASQPNHLALLIAAPQAGESAMLRNQVALIDALLGRGFSADQILCLHGCFTPNQVRLLT